MDIRARPGGGIVRTAAQAFQVASGIHLLTGWGSSVTLESKLEEPLKQSNGRPIRIQTSTMDGPDPMTRRQAPKTILSALLLTVFLLVFVPLAGAIDSHVTVSRHHVNIRSAPSKKAQVVASAHKGDRFKFIRQVGEWYEIRMFSGDYRYIYAKLGQITINNSAGNPDAETLRKIYEEVVRAEERALNEAAAKFPGDTNRSSRHERFALDRYTLEVFHKFDVTPASYEQIMSQADPNP
jgi:hypothetical protein